MHRQCLSVPRICLHLLITILSQLIASELGVLEYLNTNSPCPVSDLLPRLHTSIHIHGLAIFYIHIHEKLWMSAQKCLWITIHTFLLLVTLLLEKSVWSLGIISVFLELAFLFLLWL